MSRDVVLPPEALPFVLLQRAEASVFERTARRNRAFYQRRLLHWETRLFARPVLRKYRAWLARDYESLRAFLPERANALCDVGCGVAGIDVLLFRHSGGRDDLQVHLVDKTATSDLVTYGYKGDGEFYNSLELAAETLTTNGVPRSQVHTHEASPDGTLAVGPVDLVVSLISWGFHYPVATYLDAAHKALTPGGRVILDVRQGTNGEEEVRRKFGNLHDLGPLENGKGRRVGAIKE